MSFLCSKLRSLIATPFLRQPKNNFVTFSKVIKEQDKKTLSCSILDLTFTIGQNVK